MEYRLFLALPMSEKVKTSLVETQEKVRSLKGSEVMWFPSPRSFHFTIKFIGDVAEKSLNKYISFYNDATINKPFEISFGRKPTTFGKMTPTLYKVRVVSAPFTAESEYGDILKNIRISGKPRKHVTLCKLGYDYSMDDVDEFSRSFSEANIEIPPLYDTIDRLVLYHSPMGLEEPAYEIIHEVLLNGS